MKIKLRLLCLFAIALTTLKTKAQNVYFNGIQFAENVPPAFTQCKDYKTYDIAMIPLSKPGDESVDYEKLNYQIKLGETKRAAVGDYHVVGIISKLKGKLASKSSALIDISLAVSLYDKFGNLLKETAINRDAFLINLGRELNEVERKDQPLLYTLMVQNTFDTALLGFNRSLKGMTIYPEYAFAALKDIKKLPELKEFETQVNKISSISNSENTTIKTTIESYIPFWEKMANYTGEGDVNEVKRAALQNLISYYTYTKSLVKANEYLAAYKPIDKVEKALFGLVRTKNSEVSERRINEMAEYMNAVSGTSTGARTTLVTANELADLTAFFIIENATITLKGKKNSGVYTGRIKLSKLNNTPSEAGVLDLDKKSTPIVIVGKDASGATAAFTANISDVVTIKTTNGDLFIQKNIGASFGMGGTNTLMKNSYSSDKIAVYRAYFPKSDSYVIKKAGDEDGFTESILKGRKKLFKYLSDCAIIETKLKEGSLNENEAIEKIAELFTNCK